LFQGVGLAVDYEGDPRGFLGESVLCGNGNDGARNSVAGFV
jgi:hypothetical protein